MTTACGSMFRICSRHSNPSCPLTASRLKFISSKTTSGWNVRIKCSIRAGCVVTLIFCIYGSSSIFKANRTSSLSSIINIFPFSSIQAKIQGIQIPCACVPARFLCRIARDEKGLYRSNPWNFTEFCGCNRKIQVKFVVRNAFSSIFVEKRYDDKADY